jgi:hypothetical protein
MPYPDILAGAEVTADDYAAMVPTYVIKETTTSRSSTVAHAPDLELDGIALAVGTYEIKVRYIATGVGSASAGGLSTLWGFTGTATANRNATGPGFTSTNSGTAETLRSNSASMGLTSQNYYVATTSTAILEEGLVIVTVAGDFSVDWAQGASNATSTNLLPGTYVKITRVA